MRFICLLLLSTFSIFLYGQDAVPPAASQTSAVRSTSEEVLLDVVVRDKKGHRVDDLKSEDFKILDNGEPKQIKSFRLVRGKEAIGAGGTRSELDPLRQLRLLTMIFHCSDSNSRRLARDAAVDLLKGELPQNLYIAIMAIDFKLEVLQPFTNDTALIRKAIDRATRSDVTDFSKDTEAVRRNLEQVLGSDADQATAAGSAPAVSGHGPPAPPASFAAAAMDQMLLHTILSEQTNSLTESGRTAVYGLLDAVKEQYRLPGRKTILYFSDGFVLPQELDDPFRLTLSIANRSNVSFYAVDAHGLTAASTNQANVESLRRAAQTSHSQATAGSDTPVSAEQAGLMDAAINSTRANTQTVLNELAQSTGGTLIADTNDLRGPLRKLAEDIQTYYEITYNPEIRTYDGSFRKIAIQMASRELRVQTRSGYIALPPALAKEILRPFEARLLTALDSPALPDTFHYQAAALHFRGNHDEPLCELVMDVPLDGITLDKQGTGEASGRLSYVALLKDAQGTVVKKFQNEMGLNVPAAKLPGFQASHFIYTEHFDLPPGQYTVATAVLDGRGNRISARKSALTVAAPAKSLGLSSIAFVRNMKDREASTPEDDPLVVGTKVISPTLNPVLSKAGEAALPVFMVIYPDKGVASAPELVMEFSRNGQVLARGPAALGQPDKEGHIQFVATVPLAKLQPGDYTLRFVAKQGAETAEESASFTLQ